MRVRNHLLRIASQAYNSAQTRAGLCYRNQRNVLKVTPKNYEIPDPRRIVMVVPLKNPSITRFQFAGFTIDLQRHGLFRGNERIHLTPKPLETLIYLVENHGRTVEKQELLDAIWKETFVTEDNLVQAVREIRRALADDKDDPRFVLTIPRQGYRFVGEVRVESVPAEVRRTTATNSSTESDRLHLAQSVPDRWRKDRKRAVALLSLLAVALCACTFVLYRVLSRKQSDIGSDEVFQKFKFTRLTTSGKVTSTAVSPDGRYAVFAQNDDGLESVWLRQVATMSNVQIVAPSYVSYQGLTFSPDGNHLYYVVRDKNQLGALYQMPALGGPAKALIEDVDSAATFSPDGKRLAFYRGHPEKGVSDLVIASSDGTGAQILSSQHAPDYLPTRLSASPAWSPDGEFIGCSFGSTDAGGRYMTVVGIHTATGELRALTSRRWWEVGHLAWLHNGRGLLITAKEKSSSPSQIWYLSLPGGEARQVTNDLNSYVALNLAAGDPSSLLVIQSNVHSSVVIGSGDKTEEIKISSTDGVAGISWTPDEDIVYSARIGDNQDLWMMDKHGRNQKQLTAGAGENNWPSVTPDGRYIVFTSNRSGTMHIWRMNIDGSKPIQLTNDAGERWPRLSPDGKWVVYATISAPRKLFKVSIEGGPASQLTNRTCTYPAISPDGTMIATGYFEEPGANKTAIYSFEGGEPLKVLDFSSSLSSWTPNGRSLTYIDGGSSSNVFSRDIAGGSAKPLTRFKQGVVLAFDWSHHGQLACSLRVTTSDAIMLTNLSRQQ